MANNSIPDICELCVRATEAGDESNQIEFRVDLRVFSGEMPLGDHECQICISKLTISVDLEGFQVTPGSRYGEPLLDNILEGRVDRKTTDHKHRKTKIGIGAKSKSGSISGNASGDIDAARSREYQRSATTSSHQRLYRVKARPNLRWEVAEPEPECTNLDGTYLENAVLFSAETLSAANRNAALFEVKLRQRDLQINRISYTDSAAKFFSRFSETQRRLLDIFICKLIHEEITQGTRFMGELILSREIYNHET